MSFRSAALLPFVLMTFGFVPTAFGETLLVLQEEGDCRAVAVTGGVECRTADGDVLWNLHHPSLWADQNAYLEQTEEPRPVGPVVIDEHAYYAVGRDLMEVAIAQGLVSSRTRFPAPIAELQLVDDTMLDVVVEVEVDEPFKMQEGPKSVHLPHTPGGAAPPQMAWSIAEMAEQFLTSKDAEWLVASAQNNEEAMQLLDEARQMDATNPFFSKMLGNLLQDSGEAQEAMKAFSESANSQGAVWQDLLQLSTLLDASKAPEDAERAFQLGMQQLEQFGIAPERVASMIPVVTTFLASSDEFSPLLKAFEAGDVEEVSRLAMRMAEGFPNVEGAHWNWGALARWMEAEGADGLAREWQRIADENKEAAFGIVEDSAVALDRAVLIFGSLALALVLLSLLIGMRGGLARRRIYDADPDGGYSLWIPRLRFRDVIVAFVFYFGLIGITYYVNMHVHVVDEFATMPVSNLQDGLASPNTQAWLMEMAESPAVHELINTVLAEREALQEGREIPQRKPVVHLLVDAAYEDAKKAQWDLLSSGQMPDLVTAVQMLDAQPAEMQAPGGMSLAMALVPLPVLMFLLFLGSVLGARAPGVVRPVLIVIPGGSWHLAPLGAFLLAACIAAVAALGGYDNIIQQLVSAEAHRQLGLEGLQEFGAVPKRNWAWLTLVIVVCCQAALARWDYHRKA